MNTALLRHWWSVVVCIVRRRHTQELVIDAEAGIFVTCRACGWRTKGFDVAVRAPRRNLQLVKGRRTA